MGKKLYVGNLSFKMTEDQLNSLFTAHGQVASAKLITDKYSGQSRGFGFVEMEQEVDATTAIEKLNGSEVEGRKIVVKEAWDKQERDSGKFQDKQKSYRKSTSQW